MGGAANVAMSMANLNLDIELSFNENFDKKNQFSIYLNQDKGKQFTNI